MGRDVHPLPSNQQLTEPETGEFSEEITQRDFRNAAWTTGPLLTATSITAIFLSEHKWAAVLLVGPMALAVVVSIALRALPPTRPIGRGVAAGAGIWVVSVVCIALLDWAKGYP